jgi:hypothetical protein
MPGQILNGIVWPDFVEVEKETMARRTESDQSTDGESGLKKGLLRTGLSPREAHIRVGDMHETLKMVIDGGLVRYVQFENFVYRVEPKKNTIILSEIDRSEKSLAGLGSALILLHSLAGQSDLEAKVSQEILVLGRELRGDR